MSLQYRSKSIYRIEVHFNFNNNHTKINAEKWDSCYETLYIGILLGPITNATKVLSHLSFGKRQRVFALFIPALDVFGINRAARFTRRLVVKYTLFVL